MSRIVVACLTFCLAGCGLKGQLVLPPGPPPATLLDSLRSSPAPGTPAQPPSGEADVSTIEPKAGTSTDPKTSPQ